MNPPAPEPLPREDEFDDEFYEEDEPIETILYQFEHGEQVVTAPPPGWTGPVYPPPEGYDESIEEIIAAFRRGWGLEPPSPPDQRPEAHR